MEIKKNTIYALSTTFSVVIFAGDLCEKTEDGWETNQYIKINPTTFEESSYEDLFDFIKMHLNQTTMKITKNNTLEEILAGSKEKENGSNIRFKKHC